MEIIPCLDCCVMYNYVRLLHELVLTTSLILQLCSCCATQYKLHAKLIINNFHHALKGFKNILQFCVFYI